MNILLITFVFFAGIIIGFWLYSCYSAGKEEDALRRGFEEGIKRGRK